MAENATRFVTVSAIARALCVSGETVREWCRRGQVSALTTPGGHYRIPREELRRLLAASEAPLPTTFTAA